VTAALFGGALAFRAVLTLLANSTLSSLIAPNMLWHGVACLCFLAVWGLLRGGPRSQRYVRTVEFAGLFAGCTAVMVMGMDIPLEAQPDLIVVICLIYGLVARAVFVPSSTRRTLLLGAVILVPYVATTYLEYAGSVLNTGELRPEWSAARLHAVTAIFYGGFGVALCGAASHVIYGLRREVREARKLGQYLLEHKLGEGGMGMVYRARHVLLRRPTAIKLLLPEKAGEEQVARFEKEVRLTATLTHPNTITIYDYGRSPDGLFYYAMELLDGATLADVVEIDGPQPPARVAHILDQVAGSLGEAHGVGLIHRDIKPTNIMLCERGGEPDVAKVLDFGLVKEVSEAQGISLTRADVVTGTPLYMAPEAILAPDTVDVRSDLYALGAVGYFLLTGTHLFDGRTAMEVCMKQVNEVPEPPSERLGADLPPDLEALVSACLAKDPASRPASARAFQDRLRACEDLGIWDGRWWWEEYGHVVRTRHRQVGQVESNRTFDVRLAGREEA